MVHTADETEFLLHALMSDGDVFFPEIIRCIHLEIAEGHSKVMSVKFDDDRSTPLTGMIQKRLWSEGKLERFYVYLVKPLK